MNDEIVAVNGRKVEDNLPQLIGAAATITLSLFRNKQLRTVTLTATQEAYFPTYAIVKEGQPAAGLQFP